jgi:hypothetical protein
MVNEVQMTWHAHPVNEARAERGLPAVNSLWIEGRVPTGDDPRMRAAARIAARAPASAALRVDAGALRVDAGAAGTLVVDARLHDATLAGDPQRWADAWRELEADTFAAIVQARAPWTAGARIVLAGDAGWRELDVSARPDWRFWRRPDPAAWLAPPRAARPAP